MKKAQQKEKWKEILFDFRHTGNYRLEISDHGNLRAYNKFSDGEPLHGTFLTGYRILRLKFFRPRDRKTQAILDAKHASVVELQQTIARDKLKLRNVKTTKPEAKKLQQQIRAASKKLKPMRSDLRKARAVDVKHRTIHYHAFIHRLVAEYFCTPASPAHTVVGHLDYDKLNNNVSNLKWMTKEENYRHQHGSPFVLAEKRLRASTDKPRGAKLTIDKVRELKKLLNQGKAVKNLVKKFKITDSQILRIKRGLNWPNVVAAK